MGPVDGRTQVFERERPRLRAVAHRILGSWEEADDAVQEAWLRLERTDTAAVANLPGWLTTVVSRLCLDALRTRASRREELVDELRPVLRLVGPTDTLQPADPAALAEQADHVGEALLVVLDSLAPPERLAFVLHDLFGVPFEEVAGVLGRSPAAARQLASRARRRVRGVDVEHDRARQQQIVAAFLDASRHGRFTDLMALLHPDAAVAADAAAIAMGTPAQVAGGEEVAAFFDGRAKAARLVTLDGWAGAVWSLRGEVKVAFAFVVEDGLIREVELLADPTTLAALEVGRAPRDGG